MYQVIIAGLKPKMDKILEFFRDDLGNLRTGRANPALVENLLVDCYGGSKMLLKQIAAIQAPDPKTLFIQPWDKTVVRDIEKAFKNSALGLNPVLDKEILRISLPSLTEDKRKELVKMLREKTEQARIKVRLAREETWEAIKQLEKESRITEDDKFDAKDEIQKIVDDYNHKIEELEEKKEKDIMTV